MKSPLASLAVVAALASGAAAIATTASAQDYGRPAYGYGYGGDTYCRDHGQHTGATVLGGLAGAAIGSNMAAHSGGRSGGAAIGGVLGMLIGHQIGVENSPTPARCYNTGYAPPPPPPGAYNDYRYDAWRRHQAMRARWEADRAERYEERYDADTLPAPGDDLPPPPRESAHAAPPVTQGSTDGCRLADSPIHMPDGTTEKRFVRVCPDANGRYRVVD